MKKIKKIILLITILQIIFSPYNTAYAANNSTYFAKIENTNIFLYSSPTENSKIFEIPYSYFIKIEDTTTDYFKASYAGVSGYVKKSEVSLINGTPQTPYAKVDFSVFVPYKLYQAPNQHSSAVCEIDQSSNLSYYGTISGESITSTSNQWYYSSVTQNGQTYYGYVFSGVVDYITPIQTNYETFEKLEYSDIQANQQGFSGLTTATKVLLGFAIAIPSVLIIYFLIQPSKINEISVSRHQAKRNSKKHRQDYFEFDESQL